MHMLMNSPALCRFLIKILYIDLKSCLEFRCSRGTAVGADADYSRAGSPRRAGAPGVLGDILPGRGCRQSARLLRQRVRAPSEAVGRQRQHASHIRAAGCYRRCTSVPQAGVAIRRGVEFAGVQPSSFHLCVVATMT